VNFNTAGPSSGSGISASAGTITLANAGTYEVSASLIWLTTTNANTDTTIYFGGTAATIVGPVSGAGQRVLISGANGANEAMASMRATVITSAANQTLNVTSALGFSAGIYQVRPNSIITVSQR
jgi:hypothetical protein